MIVTGALWGLSVAFPVAVAIETPAGMVHVDLAAGTLWAGWEQAGEDWGLETELGDVYAPWPATLGSGARVTGEIAVAGMSLGLTFWGCAVAGAVTWILRPRSLA